MSCNLFRSAVALPIDLFNVAFGFGFDGYCSILSHLSGTEAGIRLYLEEIVAITCASLTSQSWTTKAQAAVAISAIAQKLGEDVS